MSETKEPWKSYWLLSDIWSTRENEYLAFETYDEALDYASDNGAFDECRSKEMWCDKYDEILFEVPECDLESFTPLKFITKEKAA